MNKIDSEMIRMQKFKIKLITEGDCPDVSTFEIPQEMYNHIAEYLYHKQDHISELLED